jgi:hypothetical protein
MPTSRNTVLRVLRRLSAAVKRRRLARGVTSVVGWSPGFLPLTGVVHVVFIIIMLLSPPPSIEFYTNFEWGVVSPILAQKAGTAWFGTERGVCHWSGEQGACDMKEEIVYSVAALPDNTVWLGAYGKVVRMRP